VNQIGLDCIGVFRVFVCLDGRCRYGYGGCVGEV